MAAVKEQGKAYGTFDCRATRQEIADELPNLREMAQTPQTLGLSLIGVEELKGSGNIGRIRESAIGANLKFVIVASYPRGTNEAAANELADLLNAAYASPLFQYGEDFRGGIAYEDDNTGRLMLHD